MRTIRARDGDLFEQEFIRSGHDPKLLAKWLKQYPVMFWLSWVKDTIADWHITARYDDLKLLRPGRGETEPLALHTRNFMVFNAVTELLKAGEKVEVAFYMIAEQPICGKILSWQTIRDIYYKHLKHEPEQFIDRKRTWVCGPTRMSVAGVNIIGYWSLTCDQPLAKHP